MKWKVKVSPGMAKQVTTKPSGTFDTKQKAENWGMRNYGSGTQDIRYKGTHIGWYVVKA